MPQLYTYDYRYGSDPAQAYRDGGTFASAFAAENYIRATFGSPTQFVKHWYGESIAYREVRPMTWREREQALFDEGVYTDPIWRGADFWTGRNGDLRDHFAHVSLADDKMIAFTEDAAKGEADRQTRMKPGKYLKKYFGDVLSDKMIAYYAEWFRSGTQPPLQMDGGMRLATTGAEMVEVYEADISSCMRDMDCVRVYAAGDLAVAYWVDGDDETVARCLVWPERGVYGRTYPEPNGDNAGTALVQALEAKGWLHDRVHAEGFKGARIAKIDGHGGWVMPYLDLGYGVDDDGDTWIMSKYGSYDCDNTCGWLKSEPDYDWTCDGCDEGFHDGDDCYSVSTRLNSWGPDEGLTYCRSCRHSDAFRCEGSDEYWRDDVGQADVDGDTWARPYAESEYGKGELYQIDPDTYVSCRDEYLDHMLFRLGHAIETVANQPQETAQ